MKTFFSIVTGIVIAVLIVIGIGDIALHHLFKHGTVTPKNVATAASGSSGSSAKNGGGGSGASGAGAGSAANNTATNSSSSSGTSGTTNNAASTSGSTQSTNTTATSNGAVSSPQQNTMATTITALLNNPANPPVDCSALVQYVYAQAGIKLPRTVAQQATVGTRVTSKSQLQYGDVVFFDLSKQPNTATFDGVYIGNGQFVARTTHGIMSIGLNSAYWKNKFIFAEHVS